MLTSGRVVREDGSGPSLASGPIDLPESAFLQNSFAPLDSTFTEDFLEDSNVVDPPRVASSLGESIDGASRSHPGRHRDLPLADGHAQVSGVAGVGSSTLLGISVGD